MNGMNLAVVSGNLGQDPEVRYTQSGNAVMTISVACNEKRKQGDEWKDHTEWFNIVIWGKRAEALGKVLEKGSGVLIRGRIQTRNWEDKNGVKRYTTEIVADDIVLLPRGQRGGGGRRNDDPGPSDPYESRGGGGRQSGGSGDWVSGSDDWSDDPPF